MSTEHNRAAIISAWKVFKTRNPQQIAAVFTEDAEWLAPANNATSIALHGSHHIVGREPISQFLALRYVSSIPTCADRHSPHLRRRQHCHCRGDHACHRPERKLLRQ